MHHRDVTWAHIDGQPFRQIGDDSEILDKGVYAIDHLVFAKGVLQADDNRAQRVVFATNDVDQVRTKDWDVERCPKSDGVHS